MKRKLLLLTGLLGICVFGLMEQQASAIPFCGWVYCSNNAKVCQCATGTPAAGVVTDCSIWRADCYYM